MPMITDNEIDRNIDRIFEVLRPLDASDADVVILIACFKAVIKTSPLRGKTSAEDIRKYILGAFDNFILDQPIIHKYSS